MFLVLCSEIFFVMVSYFINKTIDTPINNWAIKFLVESSGYKAVKSNTITDQVKLYYGNDLVEINSLSNSIIIQQKKTSSSAIFSFNEKSKLEELSFDIIEATILLLTDKIHCNLNKEHYDKHNRLKGACSYQFKNGSIQKPIVNYYVLLIKNSIKEKFLLTPIPFYPKDYTCVVVLSHDVDEPDRYAILKRQKEKTKHLNFENKLYYAWIYLRKYIRKIIFGGHKSYWNFEKILALESKYGFSSSFFFSAKSRFEKGSNFKLDNSYDIDHQEFQKLFSSLNAKGFEIGLHSSYNANTTISFFEDEKNRLEKIAKRQIIGNRHHFWNLGKNEDQTLLAHHKSGFKYDSSIAFNDCPGFRRSTALPFYPYNSENNITLSTLQIPNFLMDTNLVNDEDEEEIVQKAIVFINELTKAQGVASINWHVRMAYPTDKKLSLYARVYMKIIEHLSNTKNVWVTSFENYYQWQKEREDLINAQ